MAVADTQSGPHPGAGPGRIVTMALAIYAAELVAMAAIVPLSNLNRFAQALIDAAIMLALALPTIGWALIRPLRDVNEELTSEIRERQQRETELRRAKAVYLELFENVFDGVFEVAPDGTILRINSALVRMLGYDNAEQLVDVAWTDAGPLDEAARDEWAMRLETETGVRNFETVLRRRDGTTLPVVANFLPVYDDLGNLLFYQGTLADITERTHALEAEREARKAAETLREFGVILTRSLDLDQILVTSLELLNEIVPFDHAEVLLVNRDGHVKPRASRGRKDDCDADTRCPPELAKDVVRLGRPVLIPDVTEDPRWARPNTKGSWLGIPLATTREKVGLYGMYRRGAQSLTSEHTAVAEGLGAALAVAIQNASLFDEVVSARARLQRLSREVVELQEEDRRRIARELHDEAGQALTSLRIGLQLAEQESADPSRIVPRYRELRQVVDDVMNSLHAIATRLRPPSLAQLGLADALREHLRMVAGRTGLQINFHTLGFPDPGLTAAVETTVFRIVQESVTNVMRHAKARTVDVSLESTPDAVRARIRDDGRGFDPDQTGGRLGITGMRERAELLGGRLTVKSSLAGGTSITLEVPNGNPAAGC